MKKVLSLVLALCLALCALSIAAAEGKTYHVGELQLTKHPALDLATQGFEETLTALLTANGDTVEFDFVDAALESDNCDLAANKFIANNVDLIFCNATAPVSSCATHTYDIPILGTSVTDYPSATGIPLLDDGTTGINVSGTSDLAPLDQQAEVIKEFFPDAKTVGILYCSGEANSAYQVKVITGYLEEMGYTVKPFSFSDATDVSSVAQTACDNSDVLYIPTDNTAAENTDAIANVVLPAKKAVIAGESGICSGCGIATLSISYKDIGCITGEMAYEILVNGADVKTMPIQYAPEVTKMYNVAVCEELGIVVPEGYTAME